ncbi:MAG: hypothetical protein WBV85_07415 [Solirubrobacteraceae bacterium]
MDSQHPTKRDGSTGAESSSSTGSQQVRTPDPKAYVGPERVRLPSGLIRPRRRTAHKAGVDGASPQSSWRREHSGRLVAALVAVGVAFGIVGYAIGHSSGSARRASGVSGSSPAVPIQRSPYGQPGHPIKLRSLPGVSGLRATVALQADGSSVRLTTNVVSRLRYVVFLYSYPHRTEELFASAPGRTENVHLMSIQHLLAYKRLLVTAQIPAHSDLPQLALEIATPKLAAEVTR